MRPPMTASKNDGAPPASHRKIQFGQKEVLAENQRIQRPSKQETTTSHTSSLLSPDSDYYRSLNFDEFIANKLRPSENLIDGEDYDQAYRHNSEHPTRKSCQFSTKLKRMSSDVSGGHSLSHVKPVTPTLRNNSSNSLVSSKSSKKNSNSYNLSEVPKNIFVNNLERCQNDHVQQVPTANPPVVSLPLSEIEPLLTNIEATVSDPTRSICLNKNSASLIFTKKDVSSSSGNNSFSSSGSNDGSYKPTSVVHRRSSGSFVGANKWNSDIIDASNNTTVSRPSLQHRRSLQLNYSSYGRDLNGSASSSTTAVNNRKQHAYSWYAPVYSALEEEFETDSRESSPTHNLANIHKKVHKEHDTQETLSLLGKHQTNLQPQLHQTRIRRPNPCVQPTNIGSGITGQIPTTQNETEGPHATSLLGGPMPRRRRFENFLKSLVGRKPSKDIPNPVPLLPSPEIKITHSPSDHSLLRENSGFGEKITNSTSSLNAVQKLWNVVPLLKREGSSASLRHEKVNSIVHYSGLRKCETVLALSRTSSNLEPIKPLNRLRNSLSTSNATCSRCSSLLSLAASGSRYSLNPGNSGFVTVALTSANDSYNGGTTVTSVQLRDNFICKLCLAEVKINGSTTIGQCGCVFCTECMSAYIEFEISEGAYEISCPDAQCPSQGIMSLVEITTLASDSLMQKHQRYRLNREIELDRTRTWCPRAGCETVCLVNSVSPTPSSSDADKVNSITQVLCAVQCPTCKEEFCSGCKKPWHPSITCEENSRRLAAEGLDDTIGIPFDNELIKCCPMCAVPIEKDEGCAQMMCKRCKHVFCWYCLASLDDDFLLRHYDKGPCKNKLGHSRASVVWHRAQVIGIFAGFGILLLVASPLLLLAAPCIICCKCRICNGTTKLDEADTDFDEAVALQR